jgi:uncharacterized CHY-type Zn-finger protein
MNAELTKQIKEINADSALNSSEKSKKIQELFNKSLNLSYLNINDEKEAVTECKHYKRECNIVAKCCGKVYGCRLCHDEKENHKIDRYATEEIVCKRCEKRQSVSNKCINCGIKFGKYFCGKCRLWNDNNEDEVFHCDDCKVCRIGKREDFEHCHKCNACISKSVQHKCISQVFTSQCPICMENIFDSRDPVIQLRCGHVIHKKCGEDYGETNYQCPVCKKSILSDMSEYWRQKKAICEAYPVPSEYIKWIATIYCYDCEKESETKYHLIDLECTCCGSFNTHMKSVNKNESCSSCSSSGDETTYESLSE